MKKFVAVFQCRDQFYIISNNTHQNFAYELPFMNTAYGYYTTMTQKSKICIK